MKNNFQPIQITIIASKLSTIELYKELLQSLEIMVIGELLFDDLSNENFSNSDILLFDIGSKNDINKLENIDINSDKKIIFISSYDMKNTKYHQYKYFFTLAKPIDTIHLKRMFNSFIVDIQKENYIKSRRDILAKTVQDSPFRMAVYDLKGCLVYANIKYLLANKINDTKNELYFRDMTNCSLSFDDILNTLQRNDSLESQSKQGDKWYRSYFYFISDKSYIAHICVDITHEKTTTINLQREALFFENTSEGLAIVDKKGIVVSINEAFSKITGYTFEEALGKPISILNSGLHTKDFYEHMWDMLKYHGKWQGEIWNRRKNSEVYPEWLSITSSKDPVTGDVNYLALFTDISSIKEADQKIKFYANHDALTGLLNKNQFENILNHTINSAKRNNKMFALLFVDLDHFKEVNDTYGHNIGDMLLKTVASIFQKKLRKEDIIARIGGDEFNIILDNTKSDEDVLKVANSLVEALKEPIIIENHNCNVSLSVGIAIYPKDGEDKIALIKNADSAMYEVKKNGRDGAMIYHTKMTEKLLEKISLQTDLKKALLDDDIEPYFQPVYDMATKKITSCEVLARWFHKSKGFISPDSFIKIAESNGTIGILDKNLMKKVFQVVPNILHTLQNDEFVFAINVSSKEFFNEDYVENLIALLEEYHINPLNIELEITETYIMKNHDLAIKKLEQLKSAGFKLAIDDFGTGYSSLNYLKLFPINKLKIDKSFVLNLNTNEKDEAIVKSIINLCNFFKLEVQAEGVENLEVKRILELLRCDFLQGYYYSKPLGYSDFLEYVKEYNEN